MGSSAWLARVRDPSAFLKKPNRAPFGKFVDFVQSQDAKKGIEFWCNQLHGLPRYDLHFKSSKNRDFLTSTGSSITKTTKYDRPKNTSVTFSTISHVAWALTLANTAVFDDIFFCSFRSCRQMALPGVEAIMGSLWSMVPVRVRLEAKQSLENVLRTVQDGIITATPYEPFGIQALQKHFGHRRYLQSVLIPQPPRPDSFSATVTAEEKLGLESRLRAAEDLNTQCRLPFGLCVVLTPKGDDLEIWARYDESFIEGGRVLLILDEFIKVLEGLLTSKSKIIGRKETFPMLILGQSHGRALTLGDFDHIWHRHQRLVQSLLKTL